MTLSLTGFKQYYPVLQYISDIIAFTLAFYISCMFLKDASLIFLRFFILIFFILLFNYVTHGLYKEKRSLFGEAELFAIIKSYALTLLLSVVIILSLEIYYPSLYALGILTLLVSFILTIIFRFLISNILKQFRIKGYDRHRTLFFGTNKDLETIIQTDKSLGYQVKGQTTSLQKLESLLPKLDTVFIVQELITDELLNIMITHTKITWKIIPSALNLVLEPVDFDEFKDYPIINLRRTTANPYNGYPKRLFDVIVSSIALLLLTPLFLLVALLIKITMPGPVFFRQERLGKNLTPFRLYKFRSMVVNAEQLKSKLEQHNEVQGLFKIKKDPRVTSLGRFLRRTSIDELPQLINIFLGHMSIVGPRPHLQSELHHYKDWRKTRFSVKPGLTGLWQIKGRHELNFDKAVLYDIYYARHMSLALDIEIIIRTIPALLLNNGRF